MRGGRSSGNFENCNLGIVVSLDLGIVFACGFSNFAAFVNPKRQ